MLATELAAERAKKFRPSRLEALRTLLGHLLPSGPFSQLAFSAAMLTVGLFVGAKVLAPVATPAAEDPATRKELAQLREKVDSMTQLVAYSVARQETDNARLVQATFALQNGKNDSAHLVNLVSMLAFDPSTNVRLSALESLYAHADNKLVRDGVLSSLPRENSPLVQLAMIDFLASLRERQAAPAFETLSLDAKTDKEVRQAARRALAQL
jgi:hypothetical protein